MVFTTAFLFGATLGIAVGPIALLILGYGLRDGAWAGLRAGLGAATADFLYALVAFGLGAAIAPILAGNRAWLEIGAAALLVGFGLWMLRGALRLPSVVGTAKPLTARPFLTVLGLTIVNPLTILLFVGFTAHLPADPDAATVVLAAVCLFLGSLAMQAVFALGGAGLGRVIKSPVWIRRLNIASALGIVAFGVTGLV